MGTDSDSSRNFQNFEYQHPMVGAEDNVCHDNRYDPVMYSLILALYVLFVFIGLELVQRVDWTTD